MLGAFGYVSDAAPSARTLFGIRLLVSGVPPVLFVAAALMLIWYPLLRAQCLKITTELKARDPTR